MTDVQNSRANEEETQSKYFIKTKEISLHKRGILVLLVYLMVLSALWFKL
jgi:hypothetical protein